jgi:hypothetical protein
MRVLVYKQMCVPRRTALMRIAVCIPSKLLHYNEAGASGCHPMRARKGRLINNYAAG